MLKYDEILNGVCDELNLWKNQRDEGGRPYGEAEKRNETTSFPYDFKGAYNGASGAPEFLSCVFCTADPGDRDASSANSEPEL